MHFSGFSAGNNAIHAPSSLTVLVAGILAHWEGRETARVGAVSKEVAFSLVERGGKVRSYHVPAVNAKTLRPIMVAQIDRKSFLMTDDAGQYRIIGPEFAGYETVNHGIKVT